MLANTTYEKRFEIGYERGLVLGIAMYNERIAGKLREAILSVLQERFPEILTPDLRQVIAGQGDPDELLRWWPELSLATSAEQATNFLQSQKVTERRDSTRSA